MNLWKSLAGMMEVAITSACPEEALLAINEQNISVFSVKTSGSLTMGFQIYRRDYPALRRLCEKRGETLEVKDRKGIFWTAVKMANRPVLTIGITCLLVSAFLLPRYVLFVQVDGNHGIPTNQILEAAGECGICFGASRREVRSERVKNALLSALPQLQWAGVNTRGCVAVISVRERSEPEREKTETAVSSIVASRDGVIVDCTASRGTLLCTPGQAVKSGELLISAYTDCGIAIQATAAQGEVYAQTIRNMEAIFPSQWTLKTEPQGKVRSVSLLIGKKRINLWKDSGIWDATCGRMYAEYYVTLPGGYQLPLALCIDTYSRYQLNPVAISRKEAEAIFDVYERRTLPQQMVAGEVLSGDRFVTAEEGIYRMQGSYVCREMIGAVRVEKIGDNYGETD